MTRRQAIRGAGLGLAMVCAAAGHVWADEPAGRFDKTLTVTGAVDLDVRSGSGRVDVRTGGDGKVVVAAEIRVNDRWLSSQSVQARVKEIQQRPPIEQQGNVIRIGELPERLQENISISYVVTVPMATALTVSTGSGSQEIGALRGPVKATTGSGSIRVGAVQDMVSIRSGSGSLTLEGAKGQAEASSGSGEVRLRGVAGSARARTGSGSIEIEQTAEGSVDVSSGSGNVKVDGVRGAVKASTASGSLMVSGKPTAPWTLSAASGHVTLGLQKDAAFTLNASTHSGSIELDYPALSVTELRRGRELRGQAGGGGPLVSVESSSGGISISGR